MAFWAMLSRLARGVFLKYETLILIALLVFVYRYILNGDHVRMVIDRAKRFSTVQRGFDRLPATHHGPSPNISYLEKLVFGSDRQTIQWELKEDNIGIYSIQGRRPHMEDRYDYADDSGKSGVMFYGVYDGHGGTFASEFAEKLLSQTVLARLNRSKYSHATVNYSQVLIEEILSLDEKLLTVAKSNKDVAGSTAIVAILSEGELTVANVGDSRGVICDEHGSAIPMSYDHKPQLLQERRRIKKAGGFISFNGVWRVVGILATSRALGDFPLKEHKYIVADPDIQTFNLNSVKPQFMILATDGLWDMFTNEEAVQFVKDRLDEPHLGAKSLVLQAYYRGSFDNITVMVVRLGEKNGVKVKNQ
ncbi:protein phosphatase 1L-like [Anneissia japonica]|uniref:protein phosphatase 1L-like n=1 Tax=Anneissia japonica TaxID=1529436 RepID=UPI0014257C35|nr:protein phosphatase 1L-like [Anneissia japonica]